MVARGVSVRFDDTPVVDAVDLEVAAGAWVGLIGPNGAGKPTLLRALVGAVAADGELSVDGHDPRRLAQRELARHVAVVPQNPAIPPGMTVTDYVLLGRTPFIGTFGVEGASDLAVVEGVLDRLDLGRFAERQLGRLSGGELQRTVLARALVQQAPLLLLDEPTSALDVGHQQQVLGLVDELRVERGLSVLAAMHDLTLAGQYADELVLLTCGQRIAGGPPAEVLDEATLRRFYGAEVRVVHHPDGGVVVVPSRRGPRR